MDPATSEALDAFRARHVVVIGDLMLDEFVHGDVARISPEAPVPILEVKERNSVPGGAANAAANVASLGGKVSIVGCVGADKAGDTIRRLVADAGMDAHRIVIDDTRRTTEKTRIIARHQQVVRIDHETRAPFRPEVAATLVRYVQAAVASADACIISDYGKGVITPELVRAAVEAAAGKPIVVDPKRRDLAAYRGASVITPNLSEFEAAAGHPCPTLDDIIAAARRLQPELDATSILVTRGPGGMSLFEPGNEPVHVPARARAVFDVTGAGDTVVGALGLGLAVGLRLPIAIVVASAAAAIAVSKAGTATVTMAELRAELEGRSASA
jgi:D-beta-D-heptose 7-phosphate kinase/D-beta-D-heptose 1-phosphate adenosyltransferase